MSKQSTRKPASVERIWEGAGLGLDTGTLLYPVLSENPSELLAAIADLRQPPHDALVTRRGPGRPQWTSSEFWDRFHEAQSRAAPSERLADVAAEFRNKAGETGMDPGSLRRLLARFTKPTETPE